MDVPVLLEQLRSREGYADQIVHVRAIPGKAGRFAKPARELCAQARQAMAGLGIEKLYTHQAAAVDAVAAGRDVVVVTGTASGKSLCYQLPIIESLSADDSARALLLFPTKALSQDQFQSLRRMLLAAGMPDCLAGVCDGDTPSDLRRRLRDHGRAVLSNPDMLHASIMPQHARWAEFFRGLRIVVLDELHVLSGMFGANVANLLRRLRRVCGHYGSDPRFICSSATLANAGELARWHLGRDAQVIDEDGSPSGRRTYVFWNPPRVRGRQYRSRRSANVEAHELMAELMREGASVITFSKAKMTAEMIHRYVRDELLATDPDLAGKVTPYRGGYRPGERRQIEKRLFAGELRGVSATRALELGIDVGSLDAAICAGYPGTLAGFFQQTGRAGRRLDDSLAVLVGLDTAVNQYVLSHPEYVFERCIEAAVVDADNPFVLLGQLRCAAHELPIGPADVPLFGPDAEVVLEVLAENRKLAAIDGAWYHAASETPQHEVSLRDTVDANVLIQDQATGEVIGEVNQLDAPPILHPEAIYIHQGQTYRVLSLDLDRNMAIVRREDVDYYTQPLGGTDVHHIDQQLRSRPFGTGIACWGEVTAYFRTHMYEKVRFYELDAISRHGLDLPTFSLDTQALWLSPPESLMEQVRKAGLDSHSGLRGIGYATRMLLPLFFTCDTLDFSHSVGSANSPWNAVFIYERYPLGLGYTAKAYDRLDEILPAVLETIRKCPCEEGCPCCVGKPLRPYTTWNPERGEASIPSKAAARMILEGLMAAGPLAGPDLGDLTDNPQARRQRLMRALRRRLERMREPKLLHPIEPKIDTAYPDREDASQLTTPDVAKRRSRRRDFEAGLKKKLAQRLAKVKLDPLTSRNRPPAEMRTGPRTLPPTASVPKSHRGPIPSARAPVPPEPAQSDSVEDAKDQTIHLGDTLAARARRKRRP